MSIRVNYCLKDADLFFVVVCDDRSRYHDEAATSYIQPRLRKRAEHGLPETAEMPARLVVATQVVVLASVAA